MTVFLAISRDLIGQLVKACFPKGLQGLGQVVRGRVDDGLEKNLWGRQRSCCDYSMVPWCQDVNPAWRSGTENLAAGTMWGPQEEECDCEKCFFWRGRGGEAGREDSPGRHKGLLQWVKTAVAGSGEPFRENTWKSTCGSLDRICSLLWGELEPVKWTYGKMSIFSNYQRKTAWSYSETLSLAHQIKRKISMTVCRQLGIWE